VDVLFLCHRVPFPPSSGSKVRAFHIIRHLAAQGHRVTVASLARTPEELEQAEGLAEYCTARILERIGSAAALARMIARLPTSHPSSFGYFHSPRLAHRVRTALATTPYDLLLVHSSSMAPYALAAPPVALRVLDFCDMDSEKWREYGRYQPLPMSAGYRLEGVKLAAEEARLARQFDLCTCATPAELHTLKELAPDAASDWFPNGVDTTHFSPRAGYDPDLIVFVGRMDYFPNQQAVTDFCRDLLPELQRRRPALRFEIVGADPPRSVRALGERPGVTVTGTMPDVRTRVTRAALTVAPLRIARGTQNKVLESMAMGVPVVVSSPVARGVDAVPGEHLLCAATPEEWEAAILRILDSPALRQELARAGRARVESHHGWEASMARLDGLIATALERRSRSQSATGAAAGTDSARAANAASREEAA
jgi:sugar transferase (PEP-CTERM/EpsH1 system associated)